MQFIESRRRDERRLARSPRAGFTTLEILITVTVFMIGVGAISSVLVASRSLGKSNRETLVASEAAQSAIESVKGEVFEEAFARFNANPADDPPTGKSPGNLYEAPGLRAQAGDGDGVIGEIFFPGDGTELREDFVDPELGMPRDLNGDDVIDGDDHSGDYVILPVRVRLEWTGETGPRSHELSTTIIAP